LDIPEKILLGAGENDKIESNIGQEFKVRNRELGITRKQTINIQKIYLFNGVIDLSGDKSIIYVFTKLHG